MSRRPNAAADKAIANQAVIKNLLKLPANRVCADCKHNKLPRWASWNLGVFICIRCSGFHRGMGTHISRVKSVDLDTWTDEQLQNIVKWGNNRANKYWEANLAPGHVPSEAKIGNFIRTKYESKRWVMEGEIPDPSTLDESDDDNVPLKVVQQKLERKAELAAPPPPKPQQNFDLLANDDGTSHPAAKSASAPTERPVSTSPTKPADSLLGLDFFAAAPTSSSRPSSVIVDQGKTTSSRPDLNRSILSLYAAAPKPQPKAQSPTSPTFGAPAQLAMQQPPSAFGELNDAFAGLGFSTQNSAAAAPPKPSPFANLTAGMKSSAAPQLSAGSPGGLFSSQPTKATPAPAAGGPSGFGDFFDFGAPAATPNHPSAPAQTPSANSFNALSFDTNAWVTAAPAASTASTSKSAHGTSATMIPSNAWGSPPTHASIPAAQASSKAFDDDDWGNFSPDTVSNAAPVKNAAPAKIPTSVGFDDDLFGNVWK